MFIRHSICFLNCITLGFSQLKKSFAIILLNRYSNSFFAHLQELLRHTCSLSHFIEFHKSQTTFPVFLIFSSYFCLTICKYMTSSSYILFVPRSAAKTFYCVFIWYIEFFICINSLDLLHYLYLPAKFASTPCKDFFKHVYLFLCIFQLSMIILLNYFSGTASVLSSPFSITEIVFYSFFGSHMSSLHIFLVLSLFLVTYGNTFVFSSDGFIFDVYHCGFLQCLFLQWISKVCSGWSRELWSTFQVETRIPSDTLAGPD